MLEPDDPLFSSGVPTRGGGTLALFWHLFGDLRQAACSVCFHFLCIIVGRKAKKGLEKTSSLYGYHGVGAPGAGDMVFAPQMHQARYIIWT